MWRFLKNIITQNTVVSRLISNVSSTSPNIDNARTLHLDGDNSRRNNGSRIMERRGYHLRSRVAKRRKDKYILRNTTNASSANLSNHLSSNIECPRCLSPYTGHVQKCKHNCCRDCMRKWTAIKNSCPLQRKHYRENVGNEVGESRHSNQRCRHGRKVRG